MSILWTIIIGCVAGVIAKFIMPGPNEPSGFILTTILGIVGAFVATFLGQALGWYGPGQGAGLVGAGSNEKPGKKAPLKAGLFVCEIVGGSVWSISATWLTLIVIPAIFGPVKGFRLKA